MGSRSFKAVGDADWISREFNAAIKLLYASNCAIKIVRFENHLVKIDMSSRSVAVEVCTPFV